MLTYTASCWAGALVVPVPDALGLAGYGPSVRAQRRHSRPGINPKRIQYLAVIAGGALAGLGGAQLSLAYTQSWVEGMTNGAASSPWRW